MKEVKDLTMADLLAEGRRWVLFPGDPCGSGVRAEAVFENHPFRFVIGLVSNDPSTPPPPVIAANDPQRWCEQWSIAQRLVNGRGEYNMVIISSIAAQHRCMQVRVLPEENGDVWLRDGYGNEFNLDEERAVQLYRDLAHAYDLPFAQECEHCGEQVMNDEECLCCSQLKESDENIRPLRVFCSYESEQIDLEK